MNKLSFKLSTSVIVIILAGFTSALALSTVTAQPASAAAKHSQTKKTKKPKKINHRHHSYQQRKHR